MKAKLAFGPAMVGKSPEGESRDYYYDKCFHVKFSYDSPDEQRLFYASFDSLLDSHGYPARYKETGDALLPYKVDEKGNFSIADTGIVGGTSIPTDILTEVARRFVEKDGMALETPNITMRNKFNDTVFQAQLEEAMSLAPIDKSY